MAKRNRPEDKLQFFSDTEIALRREVAKYHPMLAELITQEYGLQPKTEELLAEVCTYCGVAIDAYMLQPAIEKLMADLLDILRETRTIYINSNSINLVSSAESEASSDSSDSSAEDSNNIIH